MKKNSKIHYTCNNILLKNDIQDDMEETLTKLFSI